MFKFAKHRTKKVSQANKPMVGTLRRIGDVMQNIAYEGEISKGIHNGYRNSHTDCVTSKS